MGGSPRQVVLNANGREPRQVVLLGSPRQVVLRCCMFARCCMWILFAACLRVAACELFVSLRRRFDEGESINRLFWKDTNSQREKLKAKANTLSRNFARENASATTANLQRLNTRPQQEQARLLAGPTPSSTRSELSPNNRDDIVCQNSSCERFHHHESLSCNARNNTCHHNEQSRRHSVVATKKQSAQYHFTRLRFQVSEVMQFCLQKFTFCCLSQGTRYLKLVLNKYVQVPQGDVFLFQQDLKYLCPNLCFCFNKIPSTYVEFTNQFLSDGYLMIKNSPFQTFAFLTAFATACDSSNDVIQYVSQSPSGKWLLSVASRTAMRCVD